jgi:hypothetical protein
MAREHLHVTGGDWPAATLLEPTMTVLSRISGTTRTLALALLIAGTAAVAPTQAQSFSFELNIPGAQVQAAPHWNDRAPRPPHGGWDGGYQDRDYGWRCLTDREVIRGIADHGFRRVSIERYLDRDRVEVFAEQRGWVYSMRVDKCTGEVARVERLNRIPHSGGNSGTYFEFGY